MKQFIGILLIIALGSILTQVHSADLKAEYEKLVKSVFGDSKKLEGKSVDCESKQIFVENYVDPKIPSRKLDSFGFRRTVLRPSFPAVKVGTPCYPQFPGEYDAMTNYLVKTGLNSLPQNKKNEKFFQMLFCHSGNCKANSEGVQSCHSCDEELTFDETLEIHLVMTPCEPFTNYDNCDRKKEEEKKYNIKKPDSGVTGNHGISFWIWTIPATIFIFQSFWAID